MTRARHRLRLLTRSRVLLFAVAIAAVMFLAGSILRSHLATEQAQEQTGEVTQQRDATAAQAERLAERIKQACALGELTGPVCQEAAEVAATPVPLGPTPEPGPKGDPGAAGPPPSPEQIRSAVDAYMAAHPPPAGEAGRPPTADEVAAAVGQYLAANPPQPGRPPTQDEIESAVATYFATNPVSDGRDGEPGRPPTAAEIRAAVDAYLAENPPPAGPRGPAGPAGPMCPDGTTLLPVEFADGTEGYGCVLDDQPTDEVTTTTPPPTTTPTTTSNGE